MSATSDNEGSIDWVVVIQWRQSDPEVWGPYSKEMAVDETRRVFARSNYLDKAIVVTVIQLSKPSQ